ncbi:MAG TPA: conjugal transfer protein TraD [Candidatus Nitrosotenuis sp.]|nr:conjugal transfer protein TraD [Candidatus Nitrosotenuis sp.]
MKNNHDTSRNNLRKARTWTLIQLGGLVEKSGLFEVLGIIPGSDLQKDEEMLFLAISLLGGFVELKREIEIDRSVLDFWQLKGKEYFNKKDNLRIM